MRKLLLVIIYLTCILTACGKTENDKQTEDKKQYVDSSTYNTNIVYTIQEDEPTKEQLKDLITKLYERTKMYTTESEVLVSGDNEIVINMLTSADPTEIINEIIKPAAVEFLDEKGYENRERESDYEALIDSFDIKAATAIVGENKEYFVRLELSQEASKEFEEITRENIGKPIYIIYDGEVLLKPLVESVILGGEVYISGINTMEEAEKIAAYIRIGKLPLNLKLKELKQN